MKLTTEPSSSSCLTDQRFPPGFRFHPTDEELVLYYLKRKVCRRPLLLDVICETDVYKWDPEELPELSKLKTGDRQWFFFSPRDRKYPNGARSNRATNQGFWKVTGKDRIIKCNSRDVGVKKTLVFYKGRVPTIERTDWVMHEYTVDEEELKRCHSAQDYYALYKVFKKSGLGPKNGEQYGAPFREEDWADDDCFNLTPLVDLEKHTKQANDGALVENPSPDDLFECPADIEELLNQIADEPSLEQPLSVDYSYALEHLLHGEDTESNLVDHSFQNPNLPEQNAILHATSQHNVQANFDVSQCGTSQLQLLEAPEFTSAPVYHGSNPLVVEEDFLEDFLEMNDLDGPEPSIVDFNKPGEDLEIHHFDGLNEFDLYHDAMNGTVDPISTYVSDNHEIINIDRLYLDEDNEGSNQLWLPDQRCNILTPAEAIHEVISPATSGVVYDSNFMNRPMGANPNQITRQDSRLSSALWDFLESIPTPPASAAESALVNMALEHIPRRLRVNAGNMNTASGNRSICSGKSKSGFLCLYVFGVLCAMLWMLLGTPLWRYVRCSLMNL